MRARRLSLVALSSVLCLVALSAHPQTPELPPGTLVVLLSGAPGTPTAEEIVSSSNQSEALPGVFATGSPLGARTLISYRASGTFREWMDQNPDHPRSQLERMVILSYPAYVDLASVEATLAEDPAVRSVGEDTTSDFYVVPNDPLMQIPSVPDPLLFQWGAYILNLPAAWDKATGHGYVGIVDVGIQGEIAGTLPNGELLCRGLTGLETGHPDLKAFDTHLPVDASSNQPTLRVQQRQEHERARTKPAPPPALPMAVPRPPCAGSSPPPTTRSSSRGDIRW